MSSSGASATCTRKMRSRRDGADGVEVGLARQGVEAVEHEADRGMIGAAHDLPGVAVVVDVPAPGQRLEADAQAARCAARSPSSRRSAAARSMPPRQSGETLEQTSRRSVPSSCITSNLRSARGEGARALSAGHAFEIAERLEGDDVEAEIGAHLADVGGRAVEGQEIVLENLDAVEPGGGDGLELLAQAAAQTHRGDRKSHVASSGERARRVKWLGRVACMRLVNSRVATKMLSSGMQSDSPAGFSSGVAEIRVVGAPAGVSRSAICGAWPYRRW